MSVASAAAWAFYRDVAKNRIVFTVFDSGGYPAPMTSDGKRAMPFWSTRSRAVRIIRQVPAYAGFEVQEVSWEKFRDTWVPELTAADQLVGVNWSGPNARGFDIEPARVRASVEALIAQSA
jgi:hypothetical protein